MSQYLLAHLTPKEKAWVLERYEAHKRQFHKPAQKSIYFDYDYNGNFMRYNYEKRSDTHARPKSRVEFYKAYAKLAVEARKCHKPIYNITYRRHTEIEKVEKIVNGKKKNRTR